MNTSSTSVETDRTRISGDHCFTKRLSVFAVFAAGAVDEPAAEGGVDTAPGTFFDFLGGADMVRCGAEEWSEANKAALFGSPKNAVPLGV